MSVEAVESQNPFAAEKERLLKDVATAIEKYTARVEKKSKKRKRKVVDPDRPKQPQSSFFLFRASKIEELKAEHPGTKITELAKLLGTMWAALPEKEKAVFKEEYEANKVVYQEKLAAYRATKGDAEGKKAAKPKAPKPAKKPAKKK